MPTDAAFTPSTITAFGFLHTIISLLPLFIGGYLYVTAGRIGLETRAGKAYWLTTAIGSVTGLFIFHHGGAGPGHILGVLMLILLAAAAYADRITLLRLKPETIRIVTLGVTYFSLWFFTTTEGLTRVPTSAPYAASPVDPVLIPIRAILFALLVLGIVLQIRMSRRAKVPV